MQKRAEERANLLYSKLDSSKIFKPTVADKNDRSYMNICFVLKDELLDRKEEIEKDFMAFATERGMVGIKGHRSVGGFRASCYNALPLESVQALVNCIDEYEAKFK